MPKEELRRKVNARFRTKRTLAALFKIASRMKVARPRDEAERPSVATDAEIATWEREQRGRATVKTPAIASITRAQLMAGR